MLNSEKKVTIEWTNSDFAPNMSNPLNTKSTKDDKVALMVAQILDNEIPSMKNNPILYNWILHTVTEKMKTVQTVENVLSYIKSNNAKSVEDVCIDNGEIRIRCSV